jgi:hypothetical protein
MMSDQEIEAAVQHDLAIWEAWRNAPPEPISEELQRAIDHDIAVIQEWLKENEGFAASDESAMDESHRDEW